jgi:hypothetical protein
MEIKRHNEFLPLKEKWKKLYEINSELSPYQSAEYAEIAFSHYLPYAVALKVKPVLFEILDGGSTIMIIPLNRNLLKQEYTLFGDKSGYGYLDFIYGSDISEEKIAQCISLLSQELQGSKLIINRLPAESLLCRYLLKSCEPKGTENCVCIDLADSYDSYLASLTKHSRHHVRTAYNRLQNEGAAISLKMFYKEPLPAEEYSQVMNMYLDRKDSRYELKGGIISKLFIRNYDIATAAMKQLKDYVHFILYIDGKPVAFCCGFVSKDGSSVVLPRLAINSEYAKFSPGILLVSESINKLFELGTVNKFDMMQGDERYKYEMGGRAHLLYEFELTF